MQYVRKITHYFHQNSKCKFAGHLCNWLQCMTRILLALPDKYTPILYDPFGMYISVCQWDEKVKMQVFEQSSCMSQTFKQQAFFYVLVSNYPDT